MLRKPENNSDEKLALVADQDRADNKSLCRILEQQGYKTASVFNVRDALAVLRKTRIDLVVLDSHIEKWQRIVQAVSQSDVSSETSVFVIKNKYYSKDNRLSLALN